MSVKPYLREPKWLGHLVVSRKVARDALKVVLQHVGGNGSLVLCCGRGAPFRRIEAGYYNGIVLHCNTVPIELARYI